MLKDEAIKMRLSGCSYNEINKKLGVPKGTLSYWFKNIGRSSLITKRNTASAKKIWAANLTKYNKNRSKVARIKWVKIQNQSQKSISHLSKRELMLIGTALYWAEGYKRGNWNVIFSNSDIMTHKLMIRFFTTICDVPLSKLKGQIQTHDNISPEMAVDYWSKKLHIPRSQFLKTYSTVSKTSKHRRANHLPYGTLRIRINDVVLLNKIKGWIKGLSNSR